MARPERVALLCAGLLAMAAGAGAEAPGAGTPEGEARALVRSTADEVLGILRDEGLSHPEKRGKIEALAYERFDFHTISRLVLARSWRRLSPEQREEFIGEFKRHLSLTYGDSFEGYEDRTVEVHDSRLEKNGDVTVRTRILGSGTDPILVDYRLRRNEGAWYVIDVIVESVSLVLNFRSQTQEIVSQVGPDGLIERLREKNAQRESES